MEGGGGGSSVIGLLHDQVRSHRHIEVAVKFVSVSPPEAWSYQPLAWQLFQRWHSLLYDVVTQMRALKKPHLRLPLPSQVIEISSVSDWKKNLFLDLSKNIRFGVPWPQKMNFLTTFMSICLHATTKSIYTKCAINSHTNYVDSSIRSDSSILTPPRQGG